MKHRPAPKAIAEGGVALRRLRNDPQVVKWVKRLGADEQAKPTDLSEEQLAYVYEQVLARRGEEFAPSAFEDALRKTTPILAAPDITDWKRACALAAPAPAFASTYKKDGKQTPTKNETIGETLISGTTKKWRGYYLVVIADQATGLPLVWTLQDAAAVEADAIIPLLSDLYRRWPDIDAELIAGDTAWDENRWAELCETQYGIHPVFRLHPSTKPMLLPELDPGSKTAAAARLTAKGQIVCRRHGQPIPYETAETPNREGARPGKYVKGTYRVRGRCSHGPHPCNRIGLAMSVDWSRLTYYPNFSEGAPARHAMREAMLIRLNGIESLFNRVKSRNLGTAGADRNRMISFETQRALLSLTLLSMTALTLADQRMVAAGTAKAGEVEAA